MLRIGTAIVIAGLALTLLSACAPQGQDSASWSAEETALITALSLSQLPELPPDPSNRVADDPAAAALGEQLFADTRLSSNGEVSCASCHLPERQFQDDLALAKGVGVTTRRTMPIAGTAYSPWLFWDGRKDSQWSQALGPLESAVEHGGDGEAEVDDLPAPREPGLIVRRAPCDVVHDARGHLTARRSALHFHENGGASETNQRYGERGGNQRAGHRAPQDWELPYYRKR
jgi:hypothetical protein